MAAGKTSCKLRNDFVEEGGYLIEIGVEIYFCVCCKSAAVRSRMRVSVILWCVVLKRRHQKRPVFRRFCGKKGAG